ncbi:pilus assembly protein [Caldifermentibacillus hisashii]|uniref:pilus assembly protein n=1 Tax=Caldifermentibacillus hisashii TaxID=996558 RepID=UPI0022B99FA8|nr:pilus assembly protein [Caldifermentibacillus hisashii]
MMKREKRLKNEEGAISFEFLGILPFYFMLFLLLWQVVASGYALMTAKTAANEAAKVFALEEDELKAENKAKEVIGKSSVLLLEKFEVVPVSSDPTMPVGEDFKVKMDLKHQLVFVPKEWKKTTAIDFKEETASRVMR